MFDIDAGKMVIVGVIALVFIPPKDLPRVLRQAGQFVGKMRRMAAEFQGQFMDAMREADMADLKREAQKLSDAARSSSGLDSLHQLDGQMTGALSRADALAPQAQAPIEHLAVEAQAPAADAHAPAGDVHAPEGAALEDAGRGRGEPDAHAAGDDGRRANVEAATLADAARTGQDTPPTVAPPTAPPAGQLADTSAHQSA